MTGPHRELVGILGGMGPAATADFYTKLIHHTPASTDQEHLRVAIWADPTVPDRVAAILDDGATDPYPILLDGATQLASLGATLVAMPCHTAHYYHERLAAETGLAMLDMVAETVAELTRPGQPARTVGVLATTGTLAIQLYQQRLAAAAVPFVVPDESTQHAIDQAIRCVKSGANQAARPFAERAIDTLAHAGADTIVLACTELPLARNGAAPTHGPRVLDPTDLLAQAVVRQCRS